MPIWETYDLELPYPDGGTVTIKVTPLDQAMDELDRLREQTEKYARALKACETGFRSEGKIATANIIMDILAFDDDEKTYHYIPKGDD